MTASSAWDPERADAALARIEPPVSILTALQAVQDAFGHVPAEAVTWVAGRCNASRADVHGVLTYYSDLRHEPPAPTLVRICLGEACQAVGARALHLDAAEYASADALVSVEKVYCLGNCALGPSAEVDGQLVGRATMARVRSVADGARP